MRIRFNFSDYLQIKTVLLSLLLILMVASLALHYLALQAAFVSYCFGLFLLYGRTVDYVGHSDKNYLYLLLVGCAIILPINVFRTPTTALHFAMVLATLGAAFVAVKTPRAYAAASFIALAFAQSIVMAFLLVKGLDNFPLEEMIQDTSSNGITSYLVCLQINYCVANLRVRGRTSLVTSAVTFFVCVIGYGRGSLLASAAILVISLLYTFRSLPRSYAIAATAILVAGTAFFLIENFQAIYDYAETYTKLGSGLYDEPRAAMIAEYWERMKGINIVIGASFENTLIERFYNGNPHNSYIRGHHFLGLLYILLMTLMAARPLVAKISLVEKAFHISMLSILLLRASTEPILFPTPFDVMYFAMFLLFGAPQQGGAPARPESQVASTPSTRHV